MPSPTSTVRQDLTDYAFGVAQDEAKVLALANALAPVVETGSTLVQYNTFNTDNAFQVYNARRGLSGKAQRMAFGASSANADLSANALEIPMDDEERKRGNANVQVLEYAKTKSLVLSGYLSHCREVVLTAQAGIAATAAVGNWSSANIDPVDELDAQIEALARYGMPNRIVMDIGAWRIAKNNPLTKKRFTGGKGFTLADFAAQLLNPNIQIELTDVGFNTYGFDNTTGGKRAMLGTEVWVFHTSVSPSQYDPSFMKTFATRASLFDGVWTYRDDSCRSDIYCLDWTSKPVVVSTELARRLSIT